MIEEFSNPFLPPAVIVHGLSHAIRAVASALPVTLLSAPGAGAAWGCLWWQELLAATGHHGPALLDCAASPGRAAEALAIGLNGIVLTPGASWSEIAALAAQSSALLLPKPPTALDLGLKRNERRLIPWLGG
jgi:hypothetical protein